MAEPRRRTILLVDDEVSVRHVAERMLELAGHAVIGCASAEEALDVLATHDGPLDALLSDVHLEGMNGPALAAEAHRRRPGMGVLLVSGYSEDEAVDAGMVPGTSFLAKPYRRQDLVAAIEAVLPDEPAGSADAPDPPASVR